MCTDNETILWHPVGGVPDSEIENAPSATEGLALPNQTELSFPFLIYYDFFF